MKANRILGLDVGTKTIGIAIGYVRTGLSEPLFTLRRQSVKKDTLRILQECKSKLSTMLLLVCLFNLTEQRGVQLISEANRQCNNDR